MGSYKLSYTLGVLLIAGALFTQFRLIQAKNKWKAEQAKSAFPGLRTTEPRGNENGTWLLFFGGALLVGLGYKEQQKAEKIKSQK